jgi:tetratricopeptide (TPR) repeat protein
MGKDAYMSLFAGSRNPYLHVLLTVSFGLLVYANTFTASFHLDDYFNIADNPAIKDFSFFVDPTRAREPLQAMSTELYATFDRRIVGFITFALNYRLDGLNVRGYHIVNLAVHLTNALLVYLFISLVFESPAIRASPLKCYSPYIALLASVLFVVHPVQTQAVTYISQRFASLAALFYLLGVVGYMVARLSRRSPVRHAFYVIAVVATILAMKTKENAFTLPFAIALVEFMFFEGTTIKRLVRLAPFLVTLPIVPLSVVDLGVHSGYPIEQSLRMRGAITHHDYLATQIDVLLTYFRLLALPINQNMDYDYPAIHSFLDLRILLSLFSLVAIFFLCVRALRRCRSGDSSLLLPVFGVFWFFLTISVESSVVALSDVIFEHRLYLPSVGFFAMIAACVFLLFRKLKRISHKALLAVLLGVTTVALMSGTLNRNGQWRDEVALLEDTVSKSPRKARLHTNLGNAYMAKGLNAQAQQQFLTALGINPLDDLAHYDLGILYDKMRTYPKAIEHFRIAISLNPSLVDAHYELALAYLSTGERESARGEFERVLQMYPGHYWANRFLLRMRNALP